MTERSANGAILKGNHLNIVPSQQPDAERQTNTADTDHDEEVNAVQAKDEIVTDEERGNTEEEDDAEDEEDLYPSDDNARGQILEALHNGHVDCWGKNAFAIIRFD